MIKQEIDQESKYDYWMKRIQLKAGDNITQNITITSETDPKIVAVYEKLAILQEIKEKLGDIALVSDRMLSVEAVAQNIDNLKAMLDLDLGKVKRELDESLEKVKKAAEGAEKYDAAIDSLKEKDTAIEALITTLDKKIQDEYVKLTDLASKINKDEAETLFVKKEELATIQTANEGKYETKEHASSVYATKEDLSKIPSDGGSGSVDLTGYEKSDHAEATYAKKTDVTDITSKVSSLETVVPTLATKEALKDYAKKEAVDLKLDTTKAEELYVKKTELPTSTNGLTQEQADGRYAKKGDIPDVSTFITTQDVDQTYAKKNEIPNVTALATKEEISSLLPKSEYTQGLANAVQTLTNQISTKAATTSLQNYLTTQSAEQYYLKKADLATTLNRLGLGNSSSEQEEVFSEIYDIPLNGGYTSVSFDRIVPLNAEGTKFIIYSYEREKDYRPYVLDIAAPSNKLKILNNVYIGSKATYVIETAPDGGNTVPSVFVGFIETESQKDRLFRLIVDPGGEVAYHEIGESIKAQVPKVTNTIQLGNKSLYITTNHTFNTDKSIYKYTGSIYLDTWEIVSGTSTIPTSLMVPNGSYARFYADSYKGIATSSQAKDHLAALNKGRYIAQKFFKDGFNQIYYLGTSNKVHSSDREWQRWKTFLDETNKFNAGILLDKYTHFKPVQNSSAGNGYFNYGIENTEKEIFNILNSALRNTASYSFEMIDLATSKQSGTDVNYYVLGKLVDKARFNNTTPRYVIATINPKIIKKYGNI